jgi:hypothetical protein
VSNAGHPPSKEEDDGTDTAASPPLELIARGALNGPRGQIFLAVPSPRNRQKPHQGKWCTYKYKGTHYKNLCY